MNSIKKSSTYYKTFLAGLVGIVFSGVATPILAGFSVTPVRIYMVPKDRAVAVTITNEGDEELVMQADLFLWQQKPNGEDVLTLTEDIFLSPPIIKMAPKSRQVVRLARLSPAKNNEQQTYRMIVREIPEAKPASKDLQLQIALAFSMPIFITPPNTKPVLNCTLEKGTADTIKAVCENTGNAYSHPTQLTVTNEAGVKIATDESGAYLLPGVKRSFEMKRTDSNSSTGKVKLSITFDDATTRDYEVAITN